MKTIDNIFEKFVDINNLREAYYNSRKGKGYKKYIRRFEKQNVDDCLLYDLIEQLLTGVFKPSPHSYFEIFEPKQMGGSYWHKHIRLCKRKGGAG